MYMSFLLVLVRKESFVGLNMFNRGRKRIEKCIGELVRKSHKQQNGFVHDTKKFNHETMSKKILSVVVLVR